MTHSHSASQILARLIERYAAGLQLPAYVEREGTETPLLSWLEALRYDRTPFNTHAASQLGLQAESPLLCEAALTLRSRLAARAA